MSVACCVDLQHAAGLSVRVLDEGAGDGAGDCAARFVVAVSGGLW